LLFCCLFALQKDNIAVYISMKEQKQEKTHVIRIQRGGQVRIPKQILEDWGLQPQDVFEVTDTGKNIIFTPKQLVDKTPTIELNKSQKKILSRAIGKLRNRKGLTPIEVTVLTVAGHIPIEKTPEK
jgi:bifunctional DNA-binding transcriptional regulator/antitoxin component of YhaV-PrlF toxin-antitoxin module